MSDKSSIEWTATVHPDGSVTPGSTWNPVRGCTKVSPGCANCYAETFAERFRGVAGHPYEQGFDLRLVPEKLQEPLKWKEPRRIFVNSMSDLFQDGVPDQFITDVFGVMALAYWHTFQILTKRPARMLEYLAAGDHGIRRQFCELQINGGTATRDVFRALDKRRRSTDNEWPWPLPNVWLGVSVENQHFADERIPLLLQTPAAVRFVSAEPLLESVDLHNYLFTVGTARLNRLHWVIVGGESGHGARPFDVGWARSIVTQCRAAGVPVFVKQLGAHVRGPLNGCLVDRWEMPDGAWRTLPVIVAPGAEQWVAETRSEAIGARLFSKKGGDMTEWPSDLRVREFPEAHV